VLQTATKYISKRARERERERERRRFEKGLGFYKQQQNIQEREGEESLWKQRFLQTATN
jgi:hypothetical protein